MRVPRWLTAPADRPLERSGQRIGPGFAERTLLSLAHIVADSGREDGGRESGGRGGGRRESGLEVGGRDDGVRGPRVTPPGWLFGVDPRAKLLAAALLLFAVSMTQSVTALAGMSMVAVAAAASSRLEARRFASDVWLLVLLFTGVLALPACFARFTPGPPLVQLGPFTLTVPGVLAASRLLLRAGASVSLSLLLLRTTGADGLLAGLTGIGVPRAFTLVAGMTWRYIFVLAHEVEQMHLGLVSRRLEPMPTAQGRAFVTSRMAILFGKAMRTAEDVHLAMIARGFDGEWRTAARPRVTPTDAGLVAGAGVFGVALAVAARMGVP